MCFLAKHLHVFKKTFSLTAVMPTIYINLIFDFPSIFISSENENFAWTINLFCKQIFDINCWFERY